MQSSRSINVTEFINGHRLAPFQILIVVLCFLIVAIDGFDTAAIGFLAPAIRTEWNLTPAALAPLFGAGLAGLMVGAFVFGPSPTSSGARACSSVACCSSAWRASRQPIRRRCGNWWLCAFSLASDSVAPCPIR